MKFKELSYANERDPKLKRWFIRSIEGLSGRDRFTRLYEIWRNDIVGKTDRVFGKMLDLINVELKIEGTWPPENIPEGPIVIVANHPFGIGDGIAVLAIAEQLGRPFRVLINNELLKVPEMAPYSLPVSFEETKEALGINMQTRHARRGPALEDVPGKAHPGRQSERRARLLRRPKWSPISPREQDFAHAACFLAHSRIPPPVRFNHPGARGGGDPVGRVGHLCRSQGSAGAPLRRRFQHGAGSTWQVSPRSVTNASGLLVEQQFDVDIDPRLDLEVLLEQLVFVAGDSGVLTFRKHHDREGADAFRHDIPA